MAGFDGELPPLAVQDVLDGVEGTERGAYLWVGPDDPEDAGHTVALLVRNAIPKLEVYRIADETLAEPWLDEPEHRGIVVARGGARVSSLAERTTRSFRLLTRSLEARLRP